MLKKTFILSLLIVVLILPVGAKACLVSVTITATNEETGQSQMVILGGETSLDAITGDFVWELGEEYIFQDDAAIESLKLTVNVDPEVGLEFGVRAGNVAKTFTILSEVVSFAPLVNPTAYASAGITLTNMAPAGATITGLSPGYKTYQARYNGSPVFANLVDSFAVPATGTVVKEEEKGNESSMILIPATLTSIESKFYFTLSARDSASGTSTFVVVPEPATVALLGLGALSLLRRKRGV